MGVLDARTGPTVRRVSPLPPLPAQLVVVAKVPLPGRVKTRLVPPCTPAQAADLAAAALADTLAACLATPVRRRVLLLDAGVEGGRQLAADARVGAGLLAGWDVLPQCEGPLDVRLERGVADVVATSALPWLLVGMDTPQVTPALLRGALVALLDSRGVVVGEATDGGWWALGAGRALPGCLVDVPTSRPDTAALLRRRLVERGHHDVALLPRLTDVDDAATADEVAVAAPGSRFATVWAAARQGRSVA